MSPQDVLIQPEDLSQWLISTNEGPIFSRDGGRTWGWVCHEAMSDALDIASYNYHWLPDGSILAAIGTLVHSTDGCTWTTLAGFEDLHMSTLAGHPTERSLVFASSFGTNALNRVFRSRDSGESFEEVFRASGVSFTAIHIATSQPERVYVSGFDLTRLKAFLYRSDDGGDTFTTLPMELPGDGGHRLLGVSAQEPDVIFTTFLGTTEHIVYRSEDGGASFEDVLRLEPELPRTVVSDPNTPNVLYLTTRDHLFRSPDHGASWSKLPSIQGSACAAPQHGELYGCGDLNLDGFSVAQSQDQGDSWMPVFDFHDVHTLLACPAQSPVVQRCAPVLSSFKAGILATYGDPNHTPAPAPSGDCDSCRTVLSSSTPDTPGAWLSLGAVLWLCMGALRR